MLRIFIELTVVYIAVFYVVVFSNGPAPKTLIHILAFLPIFLWAVYHLVRIYREKKPVAHVDFYSSQRGTDPIYFMTSIVFTFLFCFFVYRWMMGGFLIYSCQFPFFNCQ